MPAERRLTRRAGLAMIGVGIAAALPATNAFDSTVAERDADVSTTSDPNALLGVEPVATVTEGVDDQELVTLTNNTDATLDVTVALDDSGQGSVSPSATSLAAGASTTVSVSVADGRQTGPNALSFSVDATDGADLSISLSRAVDVEAGPELLRSVRDRSSSEPAEYLVQFDVNNLGSFDRVEVSYENRDTNWGSDTSTVYSREGSTTFSQWGAVGDTVDITIDVYDGSGAVVLSETITDVADGDNPPGNDDLGGPNGSTLESFTLTDDTQGGYVNFSLEYTVSATSSFQHVRVTFDNQNENWSDETTTNASEPTGTVSYDRWAGQDTYEITVDVINENGIAVDSGTITHTAGSSDSASWP